MALAVDVPVLDLSAATGADVVAGLQQASCLLLTGLGSVISEAEAVAAAAQAFFELGDEEKRSVRWPGTGPWAGWQPIYGPDDGRLQLERFEITLPDPNDFATVEDWSREFAYWPARPRYMSVVWARYCRSIRDLTKRLLTMVADALRLPPEELAGWTLHQRSTLCVSHYLTAGTSSDTDRTQRPVHTDHGALTIAWADGHSGLETALGPDGPWVPISFPPGCVLLQGGDLLNVSSRGTIPANVHRRVTPPPTDGPADRYSVVYVHPDLNSWVAGPGADALVAGTTWR